MAKYSARKGISLKIQKEKKFVLIPWNSNWIALRRLKSKIFDIFFLLEQLQKCPAPVPLEKKISKILYFSLLSTNLFEFQEKMSAHFFPDF